MLFFRNPAQRFFNFRKLFGGIEEFYPFSGKAECYYCVVNQHAITVPQNPALLHERTRNLAALYIAAGMDPKKATVFVQSEVPEHVMLGWMMIAVRMWVKWSA